MENNLKSAKHYIISRLPIWGILFTAIIILTYPMANPSLYESDAIWLANGHPDSYIHVWNGWYTGKILAGQQDFFYATNLYYPTGVSLTFHNVNILYATVANFYQMLVDIDFAHSLTILTFFFFTSILTYEYVNYLTENPYACLFAAVIFTFSPKFMGSLHQFDIIAVVTIPISLLIMEKALHNKNLRLAIVGGGILGITVFISMYVFVNLVFLIGLRFLVLFFRDSRLQNFKSIQIMFLLGIVLTSIALIKIYPLLNSSSQLTDSLSKNEELDKDFRVDLIYYFVNTEHPVLGKIQSDILGSNYDHISTHYLGYIPLLLIGFSLIFSRYRREILAWLLIYLPFFMLSLGSYLIINGNNTNIPLPKLLLDQLMPTIFKAFHNPAHFQIGFLLPFAIMTGYGIFELFNRLYLRHQLIFKLLFVGILITSALERQYVITGEAVTEDELAFFYQFKNEPDKDSALVMLPMTRVSAKYGNLYQVIHEHPRVYGVIARTPDSALRYIRDNILLETWHEGNYELCQDITEDQRQDSIHQLIEDNVKYVVILHQMLRQGQVGSLSQVEPVFSNDYITAYLITDMVNMCN